MISHKIYIYMAVRQCVCEDDVWGLPSEEISCHKIYRNICLSVSAQLHYKDNLQIQVNLDKDELTFLAEVVRCTGLPLVEGNYFL